jgi:hypothetical protein
MANLLLFEVEIGGRTCVIGGFSTNGWVTHLSSEVNNLSSEDSNGNYERDQDDEKFQGENGSFIFNLTDNLRFDEVTSAVDHYKRAFLIRNDNPVEKFYYTKAFEIKKDK